MKKDDRERTKTAQTGLTSFEKQISSTDRKTFLKGKKGRPQQIPFPRKLDDLPSPQTGWGVRVPLIPVILITYKH